jgi:plastocyanin
MFSNLHLSGPKPELETQGESRMEMIIKRILLASGLLAVLLVSGAAHAGDIKGKVTVQGIKSPENIAVYISAVPGKKFDAPADHVVIDQRKMAFVPHVVVILEGTTIDFLNSDPVGHNVYWPSISGNKKLAHNMGTWPQGQKKSFQFTDPGVASMLCNVHPEMSGYVVVVQTPYFGVTDKEGNYTIKGVPPGHYTITTWSEDGKPTTQSVDVAAATATVDLVVKK